MLDIIRDVNDIKSFIAKYPTDTVIGSASVRGMPISFLKAFERDDVNNLLPVIFTKGIEYGKSTENDYYDHYIMVKNRTKEIFGSSKTLFEPVIYTNVELWRLFNVRYANYLMTKCGVLNTCITCKAYFPMVYFHLASMFGKKVIIGEKPSKDRTGFHDDELINRLLESDNNLAKNFNIEVIRPLDGYKNVSQLQDLIGPQWYFLPDEPRCLFDKNWFGPSKQRLIDLEKIDTMINQYIQPIRKNLIHQLNLNFKSDENDINEVMVNFFKLKEMLK